MKSYRQYCGLARALDLVGERWTLLLVRELLLGPRRYSDLLATLPGITTNLLAKRLRDMGAAGLVEKEELTLPANGRAYRLTDLGAQLEPAVMALGRFGMQFLGAPRPDDTMNMGWFMVSLKRRVRTTRRRGVVELRIDDRVFQWKLGPEPNVRQGRFGEPDLVLAGSRQAFVELLRQGVSLETLIEKGSLISSGDARGSGLFGEAFGLN
jgi:DNA-binding HxlR family transcriptional regulator